MSVALVVESLNIEHDVSIQYNEGDGLLGLGIYGTRSQMCMREIEMGKNRMSVFCVSPSMPRIAPFGR